MQPYFVVAARLAEQAAGAVLLVGADDRVLLASRKARELLLDGHGDLEGASFASLWPTQERARVATQLARLRQGADDRCVLTLSTAERGELAVTVHASVLEEAGARLLLLTITDVRSVQELGRDERLLGVADRCYDISTEPTRLYVLTAFRSRLPAEQGRTVVGEVCYRTLASREAPCERCPVAIVRAGVRAAVRILPNPDGGVCVVGAHRVDERTVRIAQHCVQDESTLLSDLLAVKVAQLSRAANLSARESEVFQLILLGRSDSEIGTSLGITTRTVKYHVANLLEKLGADSRVGLMRLLI